MSKFLCPNVILSDSAFEIIRRKNYKPAMLTISENITKCDLSFDGIVIDQNQDSKLYLFWGSWGWLDASSVVEIHVRNMFLAGLRILQIARQFVDLHFEPSHFGRLIDPAEQVPLDFLLKSPNPCKVSLLGRVVSTFLWASNLWFARLDYVELDRRNKWRRKDIWEDVTMRETIPSASNPTTFINDGDL